MTSETMTSETMIETLEEKKYTAAAGNGSRQPALRVLALVEGENVNGPAKNLLRFCRSCQEKEEAGAVEVSLAVFERLRGESTAARQTSNELLEAAAQAGVRVERIQESFAFDPRVIWRLRKIVRDLNPDVIQSHYSKSHFLVWISGIWKKRPWIAFHHGHTRSAFRLRIYHGLDRWSLRFPDQITAVSQAFAGQLSAQGLRAEKIAVLHNAVELPTQLRETSSNPEATRARLGIRQTDRVILAVGRLSKEKAHIDLVSAVALLDKRKPETAVRLVIVGEGPERAEIEQAVRSAGIEDLVKMPGHVSDVRDYYECADVMVISSVSEGSPNVLLEAMAADVPIVTTAVGGIPEIVNDREHALLVAPRDAAAMAEAIEFVLSNPEAADKMAIAARALAATQYSPAGRARSLVELYRRVHAQWQSTSKNSAPGSAARH
jgi:glycosyltransferase involved in cell wall biosynthesis